MLQVKDTSNGTNQNKAISMIKDPKNMFNIQLMSKKLKAGMD